MPRKKCCVCGRFSSGPGCTAGLQCYPIPYSEPERLAQWETALVFTFDPKIHKDICIDNFTEQQLLPSDVLIRRQKADQGEKLPKPKLNHDAVPVIKCIGNPNPLHIDQTLSKRSSIDKSRRAAPAADGATSTPIKRSVERDGNHSAKVFFGGNKELSPLRLDLQATKRSSACSIVTQALPAVHNEVLPPMSKRARVYEEEEINETLQEVEDSSSLGVQLVAIGEGDHETTAGEVSSLLNLSASSATYSLWEPSSKDYIDPSCADETVECRPEELVEGINNDNQPENEEVTENYELKKRPKLVICELTEIDKVLGICRKRGCGQTAEIVETKTNGARMIFQTKCVKSHLCEWATSACKNHQPLVNVRLSAAAYYSGLSFTTFNKFGNAAQLQSISYRTFSRQEVNYVAPVLHEAYWEMRQKVLERVRALGNGLHLAGDGSFDSPGKNSAKYCRYTIQELSTDLIVDFMIWQKKFNDGGEMESKVFKQVFERVLNAVGAANVRLFVSDRNLSVGYVMRTLFKTIHHAYDLWHLVKSVRKGIKALGNKTPQVNSWNKAICNHLWFCAENCGESADNLLHHWKSLIYHIQNIHEWRDAKGVVHKCRHEALTEEKIEWTDWIDDQQTIEKLSKILFNTRFVNQLVKCRFFAHTGTLESWHNVCLMYANKRSPLSYMGIVRKTILATLDHNHNVGREVVKQIPVWSKVAKEWRMKNVKVPKDHSWRQKLVSDCMDFMTGEKFIEFNPDLEELLCPFDIPKNIADHERPSLEEMIEKSGRKASKKK